MHTKNSLSSRLHRESVMMVTLLKSVPAALTITFVLVVIGMNFLSRITLVSLPWLALNAGILISWLSFLFMDIVTKHYGAKAANKLAMLAIAANLACCLVCVLISRFAHAPALDMVVGGQWSILTASTIAYVISALTNNYTNIYIGSLFTKNPDGKAALGSLRQGKPMSESMRESITKAMSGSARCMRPIILSAGRTRSNSARMSSFQKIEPMWMK